MTTFNSGVSRHECRATAWQRRVAINLAWGSTGSLEDWKASTHTKITLDPLSGATRFIKRQNNHFSNPDEDLFVSEIYVGDCLV